MCATLLLLLLPSARAALMIRPAVSRVSSLHSLRCMSSTAMSASDFDLNAALSELNAAVAAEDYLEASRLKQLIASESSSTTTTWPDSLPRWLLERLEGLGFRYPTPIQAAALDVVPGDAVLRAATGSGKSLAYAVPALIACDADMQERAARLEVQLALLGLSPTENMAALAPALSSGLPRKEALASKPPARGAPLALLLVPRDELAEQLSATVYTLLGGYARASRSWQPGAQDSLFKFGGPKGGRVNVLRRTSDAASAEQATTDCDVLVSSPDALVGLYDEPQLGALFDSLRFVAVDEADAFSSDSNATRQVLAALPSPCTRLLAGATLGEALVNTYLARGWLHPPLMLADGSGGTSEWAFLSSQPLAALPPSLVHRACEAGGGEGGGAGSSRQQLLLLARMIRADLRDWESSSGAGGGGGDGGQPRGSRPRPRCVIFTRDEAAASEAASALRDALWGDHAVTVMLPTRGRDPSLVTDRFRRAVGAEGGFESIALASSASVLVAPLQTARGLDFANVSHVYAVGVEPPTPAEYVHMAGRVGRVGQRSRGTVTCLLASASQLDKLRSVVEGALGATLLEAAVRDEDEAALDDVRRRLEDGFRLNDS